MTYIRVREWESYQHYRDRDPPWIKLHRKLLSSHTWVACDDASRALAIAIMLLAAGTDNRIPLDPAYLRRVAYLNSDPDLAPLIQTQFIDLVDEKGNALADASAAQAFAPKCSSEERRDRGETETEERETRARAGVSRGTQNGGVIPAGTNLTRSAEEIYGGMLDQWRTDIPEVNQPKCAEWLVHLETTGRRIGAEQRLFQARQLSKIGTPEEQAQVVDYCKGQGYKKLIPLADVLRHMGAKSRNYVPPKTVAQLEAEAITHAGK